MSRVQIILSQTTEVGLLLGLYIIASEIQDCSSSGYLGQGTSAYVPSPAANSLKSRTARRQDTSGQLQIIKTVFEAEFAILTSCFETRALQCITSLSSSSSSHDTFSVQVTIKCVQSGVKQPRRWYRAQIPMKQFSANAQDGLLSRMLAARIMHWCRCHILKLTFKAWCWQSSTDEAQNYRARHEYASLEPWDAIWHFNGANIGLLVTTFTPPYQ